MEYQWHEIAEPTDGAATELQQQLGIHPVLCELLVKRGITTFEEARRFFRPSLEHLHDPFLMKDMDRACDRIIEAIEKNENILIYGDYDVDGTTAVSLLYSFLRTHYDQLITYIPDRYKEGYGVSLQGIDFADDHDVGLIIALDCGIKALDQVEYARAKNIDFIICDHHRPGEQLPNAHAILDPKRKDCQYPYKELSGCGVGFKLVQALCQKWELDDDCWAPLLDLLAVSIGADIVPITGENRVLAHFGMKLINSNPRAGFELLKEISGYKDREMSITDVVFMIGPRINAAGRIAHGNMAVELLTGNDTSKLEELSITINEHNNHRRELDSSITDSALEMIRENGEEKRNSTVLFDGSWHKGVIGIVASRLIETYYRPTIVFTESNGKLSGSARSVRGYDIYNALSQCDDILEQFGGHMYAAGMTLQASRFEEFKQRFEEVVSSEIKPEQLIPQISIDAELALEDIDESFYKILRQFAPFGPQNMKPIFRTKDLLNTGQSKSVGKDGSHLKLNLKNRTGEKYISGIGFGMADKLSLLQSDEGVDAAYHLEENVFNGMWSLQMVVKDLRRT